MKTRTLISDMRCMSDYKYESTSRRCYLVSLVIIINFIWLATQVGVLPRAILPEAYSPQFPSIRCPSYGFCGTKVSRNASYILYSTILREPHALSVRNGPAWNSTDWDLGIVQASVGKYYMGVPGVMRLVPHEFCWSSGSAVFLKNVELSPLFRNRQTNGYGQFSVFSRFQVKFDKIP